MSGFKRFLLFVFSLVGLVCLTVLGIPWFNYGIYLTGLVSMPGFWVVLQVLVGMTACFLIFNLARALVARKRSSSITVMTIDGGEITVTKSAVASQATHIVQGLGLGTTKDVDVEVTKSGQVEVDAKVVPYESIDITAEAPVLHEALMTGLGAMCGERLAAVNVKFLEPQHPSSLVVAADDEPVDAVQPEEGAAVPEFGDTAAAPSPDDTGDIVIPMRTEKSE